MGFRGRIWVVKRERVPMSGELWRGSETREGEEGRTVSGYRGTEEDAVVGRLAGGVWEL